MKFVCLRYPKLQMTFKSDIKREVNGEILRERSDIIRFNDGFYETDDEKKIAFIKRHCEFGVHIHAMNEQKKPEPTIEEKKIIEQAEAPVVRKYGRPKKVISA